MSRTSNRDQSAGSVLRTYLEGQLAAVVAADDAVRRQDADGLRHLRVALRRLRTSLATYRPLVEAEQTDPLRERMGAVARGLGGARDDEVVRDRLWRLVEEEPGELGLGAARRMLGDRVRVAAHDRLPGTLEVLDGEPWRSLRADLAALVVNPPWTVQASRKAERELPRLLRKDLRKLLATTDPEVTHRRDVALHETRKAAKRLRYACEVAAPVLGKDVDRLRRSTRALQRVLGAHHDTVVTRVELVRLAGRADQHPGTAFTLGRLHARETHEAARLEDAYALALRDVRRAGRQL